MRTDFGGCGLSGFGDMATFQKRPNFPFVDVVVEKINQSEPAKKIYVGKG